MTESDRKSGAEWQFTLGVLNLIAVGWVEMRWMSNRFLHVIFRRCPEADAVDEVGEGFGLCSGQVVEAMQAADDPAQSGSLKSGSRGKFFTSSKPKTKVAGAKVHDDINRFIVVRKRKE